MHASTPVLNQMFVKYLKAVYAKDCDTSVEGHYCYLKYYKFITIVSAIKRGHKSYENIKAYLLQLTCCFLRRANSSRTFIELPASVLQLCFSNPSLIHTFSSICLSFFH